MDKFEEACIASYKDWEATLPDIDSLPDPEYSKKHISKMQKLFDKMRGNEYHRCTRKTFKVMLIAAVLLALILCAFAIPSSRKFLVEKFEDFSRFTITEQNDNIIPNLEVGYMIEGYVLSEKVDLNFNLGYIYVSANDETISVNKWSSASTMMIDTENGKKEEITTDGVTYSYITNTSDVGYIVWNKNDYIYMIEGTVPKEELLKIAQSVK